MTLLTVPETEKVHWSGTVCISGFECDPLFEESTVTISKFARVISKLKTLISNEACPVCGGWIWQSATKVHSKKQIPELILCSPYSHKVVHGLILDRQHYRAPRGAQFHGLIHFEFSTSCKSIINAFVSVKSKFKGT